MGATVEGKIRTGDDFSTVGELGHFQPHSLFKLSDVQGALQGAQGPDSSPERWAGTMGTGEQPN